MAGRGAAARGDADQGLGRSAVGAAGGDVDVLALQRRDHLGQRDVVGLEPRPVDDDLDLACRFPDESHRADAAHVLEPALDDLVGEVRRGLRREARGVDTHRQDRHHAEVDALDDRLLDLPRQLAAQRRDLAADVFRGRHRRNLELELDDDVREALLGDRLDVAHALDGVDRLLDPLRHLALDGLGTRARIDRGDGDDRDLDLGEEVDIQLAVGRDTDDGERRHHHGREDRVLDGEIAQEHVAGP